MRRTLIFTAAIALLAPMAVLTAGPASAAGGVTCAKPNGNIAITPGITATLTAQTVKLTMPLKGCTGGVTSATISGTLKAKMNIATVAAKPITMVLTIKWNKGATSTWAAKVTTKVVSGKFVSTVTGKISKGQFAGKTASTASKDKFTTVGGKVTKIALTGTKAFTIK